MEIFSPIPYLKKMTSKVKALTLLQENPIIGAISGFFGAVIPLFDTLTPILQFISVVALCATAVITAVLKIIELKEKRKKNADNN